MKLKTFIIIVFAFLFATSAAQAGVVNGITYTDWSSRAINVSDGANSFGRGTVLGFFKLADVNCIQNCTGFANTSGTNLSLSGNLTAQSVNWVLNGSAFPTIQAAVDSCANITNCGEVFLPAGYYNVSGQNAISASLQGKTVGIFLPSNIILAGAGNATVLKNYSTLTQTGGVAEFLMIGNKNITSGNTNIQVRDLRIELPPPKETATGMDAYDNAVIFIGVSTSKIENVVTVNGGIAYQANSVYRDSINELSLGNCTNNIVRDTVSYNVTGSSSLYQCTNSVFDNYDIIGSWDDPIIVEAGFGNSILNSYINRTPPTSGKGAETAGIYVLNAQSKEYLDSMTIANNRISGYGKFTNGNGITFSQGQNNIIANNYINDTRASGISLFGNISNLKIVNNQIGNSTLYGISQEISGKNVSNEYISGNTIQNNYNVGVRLNSANALNTFDGVYISGNSFVNTSVQATDIALLNSGVMQNIIISGNNMTAPTKLSTTGTIGYVFKDNYGASPYYFGAFTQTNPPVANFSAFGKGDTFTNISTGKNDMCIATAAGTGNWVFAGNRSGSC